MWTDPIVDEVRQVRDAYAASFQYDVRKMAAALQSEDCVRLFQKMLKEGAERMGKTKISALRNIEE
jgi:hypothetical protein